MILPWFLALVQATAVPTVEARIDFYSLSNASADVELEVEAEGFRKGATEGPPVRVLRMFTWHAGGTDNNELARIVSEALAKAGLDASYDGAEVIVKSATFVKLHTREWTSLGARVSALTPKEGPASRLAVTFEARGAVGRAACVVSSSAKAASPGPVEGDDLASVGPSGGGTPPDPKKKDPKAPPVKSKEAPKRPDPKAKKSTDVRQILGEGTSGTSVLGDVADAARSVDWKTEAMGPDTLCIDGAGDGAPPKWAAIRFAGKGTVTIGVRCYPPATRGESKDSK